MNNQIARIGDTCSAIAFMTATVNVDGVEYELRKNLSHTHCRGCALKYASVKDCNKYCADGYVLQRAKVKKVT